MACQRTVNETVCVEALVTITPEVGVGVIHSFCVGEPVVGGCRGTLERFCQFRVGQSICVQVPLSFNANASAASAGIVCGTPHVGECPGVPLT